MSARLSPYEKCLRKLDRIWATNPVRRPSRINALRALAAEIAAQQREACAAAVEQGFEADQDVDAIDLVRATSLVTEETP